MKKQALLIGINDYEILPGLKYARQDAEAVEQTLKQNYCFSDDEVILLTDAKSEPFKPINRFVIENYLEKLADQELDLFIFGFWGHGLFRNGQRYFCLLDANSEEIENLGLPFDVLQELLSNIKAKNTCLFLDCCPTNHDQNESETFTSDDRAVLENAAQDIVLKRQEKEPGFVSNVAIINSCQEGQTAYDWDNRQRGIFTAHLLDAMNQRIDSVAKIVSYISSNVEMTSMGLGKTQSPLCIQKGDITLPVDTKSVPLATGKVFISYRHCNADLVTQVEEELAKRGISYFIDRIGVNYGMEYSDALTRAIAACEILLLFWTPEVKDSDDIVNEVTLALKLKKTVIPYKIGLFNEVEHSRLCYHLARLSHFGVPQQTPDTVVELVNRVEQALARKSSCKPYSGSNQNPSAIASPQFPKETTQISDVKIQKKAKCGLIAKIIGIVFIMGLFVLPIIVSNLNKPQTPTKTLDETAAPQSPSQTSPESDDGSKEGDRSAEKNDSEKNDASAVSQSPSQTNSESDDGHKAGDRLVKEIDGIEFAFRYCPPGTFTMGSPETEKGRYGDEIQHQVTLTKGFWMLETEVTLGMFKAFVNDTGYESKGKTPVGSGPGGNNSQNEKYSWRNPGFYSQDDNHPVTCVSWYDAAAFCKWLSQKTGQNIQLPTEAQWEYACRAGTTGAHAGILNEIAWYRQTDGTHSVGTKKPNAWGLYDMHGNVWEWCYDWYGEYPSESVIDPFSSLSGFCRVIRGGFWFHYSLLQRSALRSMLQPDHRTHKIGFRCAISNIKPPTNQTKEQNKPVDLNALIKEQSLIKSFPKNGTKAGERLVILVKDVEFAFRWCPPGAFLMGSPETENGRDKDETQHQVSLSNGFWIMETEVTQKQWEAIMGNNPSHFKDEDLDDLPVECVTWNDCQEFCMKCIQLGLPVHLPTEAQWEYACRAGTTGEYADNLDDISWYDTHGGCNTHSVKTKKSNAWGVYDMHGNVWEWCQDWYEEYPDGNVTDPTGPSSGSNCVYRGGGWTYRGRYCRSAMRYYDDPMKKDSDLGFRCVMSVKHPNSLPKYGIEAGERFEISVNNVKFVFRWCPPGSFLMGSLASENGRYRDETQHEVTLTEGFWMLETETTLGMYKAFVNDTGYESNGTIPFGRVGKEWKQDSVINWRNPGFGQDDSDPVTCVSWNDATAFCKWLSQKSGYSIHLPTEAQWEYACRAGTTGPYSGKLEDIAWYSEKNGTYPVGSKEPNAWGLYDMHGNVWERCLDWYGDYPREKVTDPTGPATGSKRVFRGGGWRNVPYFCRSASRYSEGPEGCSADIGFRCAISNIQQSINQTIKQNKPADSNAPVKEQYLIKSLPPTGTEAGERVIIPVKDVEFAFRWCPPGDFLMGSPETESGHDREETQHKVTLTKGFWMLETEVTLGMFKAFVDDTGYESKGTPPNIWTGKAWESSSDNSWLNPNFFQDDSHPVTCVSWNDSVEFCKWLSQKIGQDIQLPTEAQWEYACRAGTTDAFAGNLDEMASCGSNSGTYSVGMKKPNAWGLYDMHGNVWEWCQDWIADYPSENVTDPTGPATGSNRIFRGGAWRNVSNYCRSARRFSDKPESRGGNVGFRCAMSASANQTIEEDPIDPEALIKVQSIIKSLPQKGTKAGDRVVIPVKDAEFVFRYCPAGTFMMGTPAPEDGHRSYVDETQHQVTLTKGFWIMETEVTQQQWKAIMGKNPSHFKGKSLPVENVTWDACQDFCEKCKQLGMPVQLPTEAQWEYACRAGTTEDYAGNLDEMAWYDVINGPRPVGKKKANAWGLYDMHGNVWEWCQDWFGDYPKGSVTDPTGVSSSFFRVARSGGWDNSAGFCRSANRIYSKPDRQGVGFRCVLPVIEQPANQTPANQTPANQTSANQTPANQTSANQTSANQTSANQTIEQNKPVDTSVLIKEETLIKTLPQNGTEAGERLVIPVNDVEFAFRWCPPGIFMMGSPTSEEKRMDFENQHVVILSKGFWIMETEVTQKQWEAIMGNNPSSFIGYDLPVECVSWDSCQEFCMKCRQLGLLVRLPSETQWEYACRASSTDKYAGNLDDMAWFSANSDKRTHSVGTKTPNAWGLYDMHGNVWEWCLDWLGFYPSGILSNPIGPPKGDRRVYRGGSWTSDDFVCRSAFRYGCEPTKRGRALGFRCIICL